jgi:hypothetical protein
MIMRPGKRAKATIKMIKENQIISELAANYEVYSRQFILWKKTHARAYE